MRFINCPNCLSSHPDEYSDRESPNGRRSLNHRKLGRLHSFTKALFSPTRQRSFNASKSKEFVCCTKNIACNEQHLTATDSHSSRSKYRLERKHKIKKRDLLKENQRECETTGNIIDPYTIIFVHVSSLFVMG